MIPGDAYWKNQLFNYGIQIQIHMSVLEHSLQVGFMDRNLEHEVSRPAIVGLTGRKPTSVDQRFRRLADRRDTYRNCHRFIDKGQSIHDDKMSQACRNFILIQEQ